MVVADGGGGGASSAAISRLIALYQEASSNVSAVISEIEPCRDDATQCGNCANNITIGGESIDTEELENISSSFSEISTLLSAIVNECSGKIAELEIALAAALAREKAAEDAAKRARSKVSAPTTEEA